MKDPGLFTVPADWQGLTHTRNVLTYIHEGHSVGLMQAAEGKGGALELFAVIVPIEQYRRMTDGSD
jgi:hypothetical protein